LLVNLRKLIIYLYNLQMRIAQNVIIGR